jgi:hypothetical protein
MGISVLRIFARGGLGVRKSMEASATSQGLPAAEAWLDVLDGGNYAQSWETAYFLCTVSKEEWVSQLKQVRRPLGNVRSRKLLSTKVIAAKRRFEATFTFATSFDGLPAAMETVSCAVQPNLKWKAFGYLVRPAAAPEQGPRTDGQALSLSDARRIRALYKGHLFIRRRCVGRRGCCRWPGCLASGQRR